MKKSILKGLVTGIVFFLALIILEQVMNHGNTDMTAKMSNATYPLVYIVQTQGEINCMHGYSEEMQAGYLRDTITPLEGNRNVTINIKKYQASIESLSFEVRSLDGSRLVENTPITEYEETKNIINASFTIKDLIEANTEYNLIIIIHLTDGQDVRYYTRIIQVENYHVTEKLGFIKDFSSKTFDKEAAKELTTYLESNSEGDNTTYSKVNIHSSFEQITWGNLKVTQQTQPQILIKEINENTGTFQMSYIVSMDEKRDRKDYIVKEYYRIRYTADRIYLLDYERTMNQMYNEEADNYTKNKISMGINSLDAAQLVECDGGAIFAYTIGNRLFSYNQTDNKLSLLFSFYDGDINDNRVTYDNHKIKILNVDETGNVAFLVYGYMNRGRHEGYVGVQVNYYNSMLNTIEEKAYIPYTKSPQILINDIDQIAYENKKDNLFLYLDGSVYEIKLGDNAYKKIVDGLKEDSYKISESQKMIVWQTSSDLYSETELTLMDLSTGKQTLIKAGANEYIMPMGFIAEDLIYGVAKRTDIRSDGAGRIIFPMYSIKIQNESGDILKNYEQQGIYVTGCHLIDNQINLSRIVQNEQGIYEQTEDDQIMNNEVEVTGKNILEEAPTENFETVLQISAKNTIDKQKMQYLTPKEVLFEGGRELQLSNEENVLPRFYVYGQRGVDSIYSYANSAVNRAYQISGAVINDYGQYVWYKGNRSTKNQIMAITGSAVTEQKNALVVCLDTMLKFEGMSRNTEYQINSGKSVFTVLSDNLNDCQVLDLSGCCLDAILYYVNMDIPVLGIPVDGQEVLVIGFNELNIVVMNPENGEVYKIGMNDATEMFAEGGNNFITYIHNN